MPKLYKARVQVGVVTGKLISRVMCDVSWIDPSIYFPFGGGGDYFVSFQTQGAFITPRYQERIHAVQSISFREPKQKKKFFFRGEKGSVGIKTRNHLKPLRIIINRSAKK